MKITIQRRHSRHAIIMAFLFAISSTQLLNRVSAQPSLVDATFSESVLELCSSSCSSTSITAVGSINTDVMETGTYGDGDLITAVAWTGATSSNSNVLGEALYVKGPNGDEVYTSLPSGIDYADVVISYYDNTPKYRVAVVYEDGGGIALEVYELTNWDNSSIALSLIGSTSRAITSGQTDAHRPHIDLRAENDYVSGWGTGGDILIYEFGITWYEDNGTSPEVYLVEGDISSLASSYTTGHTTIGDGEFPDIALGGYEPDMTNSSNGDDRTFITYVDNGNLMLHYDLGSITTTSTSPATLESSGNADDIMYPRIEAMLLNHYADYSNAFCLVTAAIEPTAAGLYKIKGYAGKFDYNPPILPMNPTPSTSIQNPVPETEISEDIYNNSDNALMPSVCGILPVYDLTTGSENLGTEGYEIMYYSEYTHHNSTNNNSLDDGDFISVQTTADGGGLHDLKEVNYDDLASSFSTSSLPISAIATASNTGYGHTAVWYDGDEVKIKLNTVNSEWKPGKTTSVENINGVDHYIYPNPINNYLKVGNIQEADYSITDMTGRIVLNGTVTNTNNTISTESLSAGTYVLTIIENDKPYNIKIVKQ